MISVDISNVWGQLSLPDLLAMEKEVADAHAALAEGSTHSGWLELPSDDEVLRIREAADRIRKDSDVCIVVGAAGKTLGSRAAIELLQGPNRNIGKGKGDPMLFFTGSSLSTRHLKELTGLLKETDFSVIVISGYGTDLEPGIAFRNLRWMLERKYGTDEANRRIYAVTDPSQGALRQMAVEEGWEVFDIPSHVSDGHCVLTAAGLLPMAAASIDIHPLLQGASDAREQYDLRSYDNPVWLYAAVRNQLQRSSTAMEVLAGWEPGFRTFGLWWQQLFGQTGGKDGKGLFPVPVEFPGDLHGLGQTIQHGPRNIFETLVRFDPPEQKHIIGGQWKDLDGLNYLEGKSLDQVEEQAYQAAIDTHTDSGIPVITMDCGPLEEASLGHLFFFLTLSCGISACILGSNPFDQSGTELYKSNLFRLLGKPETEPGE